MKYVLIERATEAQAAQEAAGLTPLCKATPVILHGIVSPECRVTPIVLHEVVSSECKVTPVILHGVVSTEPLFPLRVSLCGCLTALGNDV